MARNEDIVTYLITDHIADLQEKNNGWIKELNLVCWNGSKYPKFDIRDWSKDHQRMSRGLTFTEFEFDRMVQEYLAWRSDAVVKQKRAERLAADQESRRQRDLRAPAAESSHIPDPIPPVDEVPPSEQPAPPESVDPPSERPVPPEDEAPSSENPVTLEDEVPPSENPVPPESEGEPDDRYARLPA